MNGQAGLRSPLHSSVQTSLHQGLVSGVSLNAPFGALIQRLRGCVIVLVPPSLFISLWLINTH